MNLYTRCTSHVCCCCVCVFQWCQKMKCWIVLLYYDDYCCLCCVSVLLCCIYYCLVFGQEQWHIHTHKHWWWLYISGMIILSSQKTLFVYVLLYDSYVFVIFSGANTNFRLFLCSLETFFSKLSLSD